MWILSPSKTKAHHEDLNTSTPYIFRLIRAIRFLGRQLLLPIVLNHHPVNCSTEVLDSLLVCLIPPYNINVLTRIDGYVEAQLIPHREIPMKRSYSAEFYRTAYRMSTYSPPFSDIPTNCFY